VPVGLDPFRGLAGLVLSSAIASAAYKGRALSTSGAYAAIVVATACTAAGWSWAWLLIAFFVTSTLLSKTGQSAKRALLSGIADKGTNRDAWQVLANGAVFGALALATAAGRSPLIQGAAAGALAASTADTWATEIGTLSRRLPRNILSMKVVPRGTSGGVTLLGMGASLAGGTFIAIIALLTGWPASTACAAVAGGLAGSMIDSILGATIQEKRWCSTCGRGTERAVHDCGTATTHAGGIRRLDNDFVNFISSIGGAITGLLCLI
jgi:uncharacterized protein (TIGR00297 family)